MLTHTYPIREHNVVTHLPKWDNNVVTHQPRPAAATFPTTFPYLNQPLPGSP